MENTNKIIDTTNIENGGGEFPKSSRVFWLVFIFIVICLGLFSYYEIVISRNYLIQSETSCDPATEKCYVFVCDPADDDTCPSEVSERTTYYKKIFKKASSIALCEATEEKSGCGEEYTCIDGEKDCSYVYCDSVNLDTGEECADIFTNSTESSSDIVEDSSI